MGLVEIAESVLSRATQRVEISAQNLANMATPAYKAHRPFVSALDDADQNTRRHMPVDFTIGKLQQTGNPFDLAISGSGFFAVRSGDEILYSRNGQFHADENRNLVTSEGMILQSSEGNATAGIVTTVLSDGTIIADGSPAGRLSIVDFSDLSVLQPVGDGMFAAPAGAAMEAPSPMVRQGMLEASNVSAATEMLSMMAALRGAQTGQRVVQIYDDLMGRAITAFGQM